MNQSERRRVSIRTTTYRAVTLVMLIIILVIVAKLTPPEERYSCSLHGMAEGNVVIIDETNSTITFKCKKANK